MCVVRVPFAFVDPSFLRGSGVEWSDDVEWQLQNLLRLVLSQPDFWMMPTASASVALYYDLYLVLTFSPAIAHNGRVPYPSIRFDSNGTFLPPVYHPLPPIAIAVHIVTKLDSVDQDDGATLAGSEAEEQSLAGTLVEVSDSDSDLHVQLFGDTNIILHLDCDTLESCALRSYH
ncbi:hypothetical protein PENSPDRAFT_647875 [Peniophora sp. CONT]|nr:hypothetical protein PENSPDRAFT_647875 [Peniophora sp. CONT]